MQVATKQKRHAREWTFDDGSRVIMIGSEDDGHITIIFFEAGVMGLLPSRVPFVDEFTDSEIGYPRHALETMITRLNQAADATLFPVAVRDSLKEHIQAILTGMPESPRES